MKREKDIVEFFDRYSEMLLPEQRDAFMKSLKKEMRHLPVPSAFKAMHPEMSKEYTQWLIHKMKREYGRRRREALIICLFTVVTMTALLAVIYASGVFSINKTVTVVALSSVSVAAVGFIYSMMNPTDL